MRYIDSGYAVALTTFVLYSLRLAARRVRLQSRVQGPVDHGALDPR